MNLGEVLDLLTELVVNRIRAELDAGVDRTKQSEYWLILKDRQGVELTDFDEPYRDASEVVASLIHTEGVTVAALVTRHSGGELLLAAHVRQGENIVSCAYQSHVVPMRSRSDDPKIAEWARL